jgi:hypothetical protein
MTMLIQSPHKLLVMAVLLGLSAMSANAFAARPPGAGGGNGGGGGSSGSPDLGDLFVLLRDADGVPILTADSCQQPLAAATFDGCINIPGTTDCRVIPVDPATCAVAVGFENLTQEVDFGRTSVVRSPVTVLESQLDDVIVNLATADCTTLDPAGRLVTSTVTDGVVSSAAIDSPLQNLAIYRQLMLTGTLGRELPDPTALNTAARGLGAAIDKTGKVTVDTVAYLNQIMGLADESVTTFLPKKCINVREEVNGVVQTVRKCFLDYSATGGNYAYDRTANFTSLPTPPYIPSGAPLAGWFEYLGVVDPATPTFGIAQGPILEAVPELLAAPTLTVSNIGGFAQAADDARAVINFMHSWPLPVDFATPLTCTASGSTTYDVSISPDSGLQVPVQMVDGTAREFTVTVANAGPQAASGSVTVTAVAANGTPISGSPWTFPFDVLAAGSSKSFPPQAFSINSGERTTIAWTATATAEFDVNTSNNTVTETTSVRVTGGGGRGR